LTWSEPLNIIGVRVGTAEKIIGLVINTLLLTIGGLGLLGLIAAVYQRAIAGDNISTILWDQPQLLIGGFCASLMTNLFLYYRLEQDKARHKKIEYRHTTRPYKRPLSPDFDKVRRAPFYHRTDILQYTTEEVRTTIHGAVKLAKQLHHHQITPLHLFGAILETTTSTILLTRLGADRMSLLTKLGKAMRMEGMTSGSGLNANLETKQILFLAYNAARQRHADMIEVLDVFIALVDHDPWVRDIMTDAAIDPRAVEHVIAWMDLQQQLRQRYLHWKELAKHKPRGSMDRAMTARQAPLLDSLTQDYTRLAAAGTFFPQQGRDNEMQQVVRILREATTNVLLVGDPGVGKSTIFQGLAEIMASEEVPKELQDKRFVVLDPGSLIADATGMGVLEGRLQTMINEMMRSGNLLLGIEDIHHLVNMRSGDGSEDLASILMNALSRGTIKVIATTTTAEYQQFLLNHPQFLRRFQIVQVPEISRDTAIQVLQAKTGALEFKHKVFFTYQSIVAIVDDAIRFIQDRKLPAKALDIMSEVASQVELQKGAHSLVGVEDVARVISERTQIPVTSLTESERDKLLNLERLMHERIVGQDQAVTAVAGALRRARSGLRDVRKPIASLLFLGPTGVGKTETAKAIAVVYFGSEQSMIRLDMTEYQTPDALAKLIGAAGSQGLLTEHVRLKPFSLILLDELEKAHPDILNVFLQVMDDGRLTDGRGQTFDMTNTMIIATSNAGTDSILNATRAGLPREQLQTMMREDVLPQIFRPEFLNRFDTMVIFEPLSPAAVVQITTLLLQALATQLNTEKQLILQWDQAAVEELAARGYDPLYGARPLKRVLQDTVEDALSKLVLSNQLHPGDTIVLQPGGQLEVQARLRL
jgi:ATP-dependent Clp protease ATP-binding subunit ClpC